MKTTHAVQKSRTMRKKEGSEYIQFVAETVQNHKVNVFWEIYNDDHGEEKNQKRMRQLNSGVSRRFSQQKGSCLEDEEDNDDFDNENDEEEDNNSDDDDDIIEEEEEEEEE